MNPCMSETCRKRGNYALALVIELPQVFDELLPLLLLCGSEDLILGKSLRGNLFSVGLIFNEHFRAGRYVYTQVPHPHDRMSQLGVFSWCLKCGSNH